jgi:HAD superfamily hydrolase (TIGR01509 family)
MTPSANQAFGLADDLALPPFEAVVMDMDGLALDTEAAYCDAWQAAAAALGYDLSDCFCRGLFGRHADDVQIALTAALGESFDRPRFYRLAAEFWHEHLHVHGVAKMPALDRLLHLLRDRGVPYALATNSDAPFARKVLHRAGALEQFPVIVTRDEVANGKPAPDLFVEAARRLDVAPSACLGLEDSVVGLQACCAAGMIPILIPSEGAQAFELPGTRLWILDSLAVLADYIEQTLAFP